MIIKVAVLLIVMFLVYILFFKKNREQDIKKNKTNEKKKDTKNISDTMMECPTCKVFVSKSEAILSNGKYFCSKECLK